MTRHSCPRDCSPGTLTTSMFCTAMSRLRIAGLMMWCGSLRGWRWRLPMCEVCIEFVHFFRFVARYINHFDLKLFERYDSRIDSKKYGGCNKAPVFFTPKDPPGLFFHLQGGRSDFGREAAARLTMSGTSEGHDGYALGIVFFWLCWEKTFQGKGRPWQTYSDFKVETGGCYFEVLTIACCAGSLQVTQDKIDFQSVPNPVFILDIGEPTTFANQSLDTGFSSFKSSNFGWLKGKQTQTWWQSHTEQNTHVHTEKEGPSSKRAIKKRDRQTNKKTNRQTEPPNYRDTHSISWATSTDRPTEAPLRWGTGWEGCHTPTFTWPLQV